MWEPVSVETEVHVMLFFYCCTMHVAIIAVYSNSCTYTLSTHATLTFKTLKKLLKNILVKKLPLHVSVHLFDHPQGAHMPYFVLLLDYVRLICVR